jgi:HlyD family secretion protein
LICLIDVKMKSFMKFDVVMEVKMKRKKRVLMITVVLIVMVSGGFLLKSFFKQEKQDSFQLEPIKKGNLENIVSSTGTLMAVQTVEVGSQVSGILADVLVDFNDSVKKGQVLAILDKTLFQVAVQDARAGVIRAKAKLDQANAELKRNQPLFEKGYLAETGYLAIKTAAETAEADLQAADAALKRAQTNLDYTVIRSPISGTVIERTVEAGQTIAASFQAPKLFIIAEDLTRMQIEVNVDESDIGLIKENQAVRFDVQAYIDEKFTGKVRQIRLQPTTIQNVVNYTVVVDAANENRKLLPGMTATVDFLVEEKKDVLMVPNAALSFKPSLELMQKYGTQIKKKMRKTAPQAGMDNTAPRQTGWSREMMKESLPDNMGTVFYLDKQGIPTTARLTKGTTDGRMTEIVGSRDLKEGMEVITAYKSGKDLSTKSQSSVLMPHPPRAGR